MAKDVLAVLQAPEQIAAALEQCQYVAAAVYLLTARERYEALQRSSSSATREWLAVPFVRMRTRTLMDQSQVRAIVEACRRMLGGQTGASARPDGSTHENSSAYVADAVGASILVQGLSLRDALETFLEARSEGVRSTCQDISAAAPEVSASLREDGLENVEALEALLRQVCLAIADTVCQALHLFCAAPAHEARTAEKADGAARAPRLVKLLNGLAGLPIRRDMQIALEESECSAAVGAWLQAMSAAVQAATAAALHRVRAGKALAALELALRACTEQALGRGGEGSRGGSGVAGGEGGGESARLWGKVSEPSPWSVLFASAFLKRSKEVLAARFSAIQGGVGPLLSRELHAILDDATFVSHVPGDGHAALQGFFAASGGLEQGEGSGHVRVQDASQPWVKQSTPSAHGFLGALQAAVMDCQQLVAESPGAGQGGGGGRGGGGGQGVGDGADDRADLLGRSAREAVEQFSALLLKELEAVEEGAADQAQVRVDQALYLAQTASSVEAHVPCILELLPATAGGSPAAAASGPLLATVSERGYGFWARALVERGAEQLAASLRAVRLAGSHVKRAWEEVVARPRRERRLLRSGGCVRAVPGGGGGAGRRLRTCARAR